MLSAILVFLIILIFVSSVNINLRFVKEDERDNLVIKIKMLYGLIRFKKEINEFKVTTKKENVNGDVDEELEVEMESDSGTKKEIDTDFVNLKKNIETGIEAVKRYRNVINYVINRVNFHTLLWKTEVGFDDAALTGVAIGFINILKSNIFVMFNNISIRPNNIYFRVFPNFNRQTLKTNIHSIFKMKLGYIIIAGLKYLLVRKK